MLLVARKRAGFSLVELVVVVMILGILGAIAGPRLLSTSQRANDNALRHTLAVIRDAIHGFAAENAGELPGADGQETTFKTDLQAYLRGSEFPTCPVGPANNRSVRMMAGAGSVSADIPASKNAFSWVYKYETGDFHVNCDDLSADGAITYDQF